MRILILTAGERVSKSGLYKSQVLDIAVEFAKNDHQVEIVSFLPYINTDLCQKGLKYENYLNSIKSDLRSLSVGISIIRLPVTSHFQFLGHRAVQAFWSCHFFRYILKRRLASFKPDVIHCRALLACTLTVQLPQEQLLPSIVNFDLRGNAPLEATILYSNRQRIVNSLLRLQSIALAKSHSITCVSEVLAHQCGIHGNSNVLISNIASAIGSLNGTPELVSAGNRNLTKFVFIGSFGKSWYPVEEFIKVAAGIKSVLDMPIFSFLAPKHSHRLIARVCSEENIQVDCIDHFHTRERAIELTQDATFGILPYRQPLQEETQKLLLAQTVMSAKLSDYICLNLIPVVPKWCLSASTYVLSREIGYVYNECYDFDFFKTNIDARTQSMRRKIVQVADEFTVESVAVHQLDHFSRSLVINSK
jgi:hypothetical protein